MALKHILNTIDLTKKFSWCCATSDYSESKYMFTIQGEPPSNINLHTSQEQIS